MFERIRRLAERAANGASVSRRGFLGRLGQGALAAAGVIGGLMLLPKKAQAGDLMRCIHQCCQGTCGKGDLTCACDPTGYAYTVCYEVCVT
jgi:hypothetical protein